MHAKRFRNPLVSIALMTSVLFLTSLASAKTIDKSFDVDTGDTLTVRTDVGSVNVRTHNKDVIEFSAEIEGKNSDDFNVTFDNTSKGLTIHGKRDRDNRWGYNNLRVKFSITIPKEYDVNVDTAGGSISVDDLVGNVDVDTSGGSIRIGDIEGDVKAETSGGSIKTQDIDGNVNAHTSGGSIKVTMTKQLTENASLTTSGGSVTANLVNDIKINIDASTSGGRVRSDFSVDGKTTKRSVRGEINGGGPKLRLKTSGGSIHINSI